MGAKNKVIAGDYENWLVITAVGGGASIAKGFKSVPLKKQTVESYELVTDELQKSAASGRGSGLIGGALLGPVGMLAGGLSAKSKGIYTVAIQFKDGTKSLIEVNDKLYKAIVKSCF